MHSVCLIPCGTVLFENPGRPDRQLMKPTKLATFLIALICSVFGAVASGDEARRGRIVFLGDSLTAGYGVEPDQAFPTLVSEKINAAGLPFDVAPSGLSGETSAGGLRRAGWVL